jgi:hypothetical protein
MAPARSPEKDFARAGYLETFGCRFFGFDTFGTSHIGSFG